MKKCKIIKHAKTFDRTKAEEELEKYLNMGYEIKGLSQDIYETMVILVKDED